MRRFFERFAGGQLEVTTDWRFVVEELRAIGADVHLAETAARRANKKRAKTDRADAC